LGTERMPCPPHIPLASIQAACFQQQDPLTVASSTAPPVAHSTTKKSQASQGRKKRSRASDSRDRQRQLVVSHSVLIGLSQNVVNLTDDDESGVSGGTSATVEELSHSALVRLPVQLLVERYLMLILNALGNVVQGSATTSQHKLRALRVLEVCF
jgi:hypothetical protein